MPCEPRVYDNVSPERFYALVAKAQKEGLYLIGTSGMTKAEHCTFHWSYTEGKLTITPIQISMWTTCDHVGKKLDELMKE